MRFILEDKNTKNQYVLNYTDLSVQEWDSWTDIEGLTELLMNIDARFGGIFTTKRDGDVVRLSSSYFHTRDWPQMQEMLRQYMRRCGYEEAPMM